MLKTCTNCGSVFSALTDDVSLCAACRVKGVAEPNATDWRRPLYDYAVAEQRAWKMSKYPVIRDIYIRLGDFLDSEKKLAEINEKVEQEYNKAVEAIGSDSTTRLQGAISVLKEMQAFRDTSADVERAEKALAQVQENIRLAQEEAARKEARRKRVITIAIAAIIAAVILAVVGYGLIVPPGHIRRGDDLRAQGQYEEALAAYDQGSTLWHAAKCDQLKLDTRFDWADSLLAEGEYEDAISMYRDLGEEDSVNAAYLAWTDDLAAKGETKEAIYTLNNVDEGPERTKRYAELKVKLQDDIIARASAGELTASEAAQEGSWFLNIDEQLRYCRVLDEAGYDLFEVYPDGVSVNGVRLNEYQPDAENLVDTDYIYPAMDKILVFERTELYNGDISALVSRDSAVDGAYTVKLLPGYMFSYEPDWAEGLWDSETLFAETWEDCQTIIIMDSFYWHCGTLTEQEKTQYGTIVGSKELPYFAAINDITSYSKDEPQRYCVSYIQQYDPICASDNYIVMKNTITMPGYGTSVSEEDRVGTFHTEDMYAAADDSLYMLALMGMISGGM